MRLHVFYGTVSNGYKYLRSREADVEGVNAAQLKHWPRAKACIQLTDFAGASVAVARSILALIDGGDFVRMASANSRAILITEHGIWPSSENRHLYYIVRRAHGDLHALEDKPFHLFSNYELNEFVTILDLMLRFGWGGWLLGGVSDSVGFLSHDGWLRLASPEALHLGAGKHPNWNCIVEAGP